MIYVECDNDSSLFRYLGYKISKGYRHPDGKGGVLGSLKETKSSLGVVDEDPGKPNPYPQLSNFHLSQESHNLRLYQHHDVQTRKFIEIPDDLETWFMRLGRLSKLDLNAYNVLNSFGSFEKDLPDSILHPFLNAIESQPGFQQFVKWVKEYG